MRWRFSLIDRAGVQHFIDEPVGWDGNKMEIKRDLEWHGIVFTYQGESFQYDGKAMQLIDAEYNQWGVQGQMTQVLEEDCGNGFVEFSRGRLMFKNYEKVCGDECYVKLAIETTNETRDLRTRINQKVNLEATKAFDEVTTLQPYEKLGFNMPLPSKGIFVKDHAVAENNIEEYFAGGQQPIEPSSCVGPWNLTYGQITLAMDKKAAEIGAFSFNPVQQTGAIFSGHFMDNARQNAFGNLFIDDLPGYPYPHPGLWPLNVSDIVNLSPGSPNYADISNPVQLGFLLKGKIDVLNCVMLTTVVYLLRLPENKEIANNGELLSHYNVLYRKTLYNPSEHPWPAPPSCATGWVPWYGLQPGESIDIGCTFVDNNFTLNKGDRLFLFITTTERKNPAMLAAVDAGAKAFKLTLDKGSFFKISNLSRTEETSAKVYAVNEALSRVSESLTNDSLRVYSEYFGRTDSQPYAVPADGCGALEVITDGIRLRNQENRLPDSPSLFSVSLQDMFNGLNPIHNIGMGVEPDPARPGFNRLRVESWKHFYNTNVTLSCTDVNKITRKLNEKDVFSTFTFGYEKWEAEEYTGLDEFLTKRSYRTTLSEIKNDLPKLSKFIASGYALEITRRKGDNNSKDWRYDKDTFIICCKRNNGGDLVVELGNVLSPQNIIDPETLYNYRISPIRNAMRWLNHVLVSYRQFNPDAKLIFTDGDANYYASGRMQSPKCRLEAGVIVENGTLDLTLYAEPGKAQPFLAAERVNFDYPMTSQEYKLIESNPYGLIYYQSDCEEGYGWIDTLVYTPEQGTASFNLIPQVQ
ncbi:hypothetical protein JMG10_07615 [Nostoc ellipsosporum NOK]|nr:hypothetical protein [Nostoc ellipsosporum NOK]